MPTYRRVEKNGFSEISYNTSDLISPLEISIKLLSIWPQPDYCQRQLLQHEIDRCIRQYLPCSDTCISIHTLHVPKALKVMHEPASSPSKSSTD